MSNLWLKIKVWTKLTVFVLVLIYVIIFVAQNSAKEVHPWFWRNMEPQTTLLLLVLYAFLAGVLCTFLLGTTLRTIRQVREIRERQRTERMQRTVEAIETKAAMLRSRPETDSTSAHDEPVA